MSAALSFIAADKSWAQIVDAAQTGLDPLVGDFSIACYFSVASYAAERTIIGKGGLTSNAGYRVLITTAGKLQIEFGDGSGSTLVSAAGLTTLQANTQYSVTVTFDRNDSATVYLNGASEITLAIGSQQGSVNSAAIFAVGATYATTRLHQGTVSFLRFWSRLLTADEIARQANMSGGVPYARPYAQLNTAEKIGLVSAWDEPQATFDATHQWLDLHGTNHLSFASANIIDATTLNGGFETVTAGTEALSNTGFETYTGTQDDDVNDTITGWSQSGGRVEATATVYAGSSAAKLRYTTAAARIYRNVSVTAREARRFSVRTRGDGTKAGQYSIYDVTNSAWIIPATSTGVSGTSYTLLSVDYTVPANCTSVQVSLYSPSSDGWAFFDDVSDKPLSPAAWTKSESGTSKVQVELAAPYAGTYGVRLDVDGSGSAVDIRQASLLTLTKRYTYSAHAKHGGTSTNLGVGDNNGYTSHALTASYAQYSATFTTAGYTFLLRNLSQANKTIYLDNITLAAAEVLTGVGPLTTTATKRENLRRQSVVAQYDPVYTGRTTQVHARRRLIWKNPRYADHRHRQSVPTRQPPPHVIVW